MTTQQTICNMLTENTGTHMLDSGGEGGRNWQQNQGLTVAALEAAPSATLEVYHSEKWGYDLSPTIDVYHFLCNSLEIDDICEEFNAMPVNDWEGNAYGLSRDGESWLLDRKFMIKGAVNTYNGESSLSQVLQYTYLSSPDFDSWYDDGVYDGDYLLLQIHGGADVRGGYTDAKLFKINSDCLAYEICGFLVETKEDAETLDMFTGQTRDGYITLDWSGGEWIANDGESADDAYLTEFAKLVFDGRENEQSSVTICGDSWGS